MFHEWGLSFMWFGGLFWLLFFGVIIWAVIRFTSNQNQNRNSVSEDEAIQILKKRYAKGEITKEEYDKIKSDILN